MTPNCLSNSEQCVLSRGANKRNDTLPPRRSIICSTPGQIVELLRPHSGPVLDSFWTCSGSVLDPLP
eukprot:8707938-Pyramimonas_sp.AAC.1